MPERPVHRARDEVAARLRPSALPRRFAGGVGRGAPRQRRRRPVPARRVGRGARRAARRARPASPSGTTREACSGRLCTFSRSHCDESDNGVREVRGRRRTSCTPGDGLGTDRMVRAVERFGFSRDRPTAARSARPHSPRGLQEGLRRRPGTFTQYYGGPQLDAALSERSVDRRRSRLTPWRAGRTGQSRARSTVRRGDRPSRTPQA